MDRTILRQELIRDEGLELKPYRCTSGKLSIGVGRNIEDRGISKATAMQMLDEDFDIIETELDRAIPWWRTLSEARQRALINMAFMGVPRLLGFKKMLTAMQAGAFERAADEALDSKWAAQVGARSQRVAKLIREG